jgi:hypothetical protein
VRQHPGSRAYHRNSHDVDFELRLVLAGLALAEAIAVAVHLKDVHVVGQPIKKCAGPLCQGCCPLLYFSLIFRWAG